MDRLQLPILFEGFGASELHRFTDVPSSRWTWSPCVNSCKGAFMGLPFFVTFKICLDPGGRCLLPGARCVGFSLAFSGFCSDCVGKAHAWQISKYIQHEMAAESC